MNLHIPIKYRFLLMKSDARVAVISYRERERENNVVSMTL